MSSLLHEKLQSVSDRFAKNPLTSALTVRIETQSGDQFFYSKDAIDHPAFIASSTKTFMSELYLQLSENGQIDLDSPLTHYLPESELRGLNTFGNHDNFEKLTARQLLRNTSGIPDYYRSKALKPGKNIAERTASDPGWSYQEALEIARSKRSTFEPGAGVQYSFTNFQILSELSERILSEPLGTTLKKKIFSKLNLNDTYLFTRQDSNLFETISPLLYGKQSYLGANRMTSLRGEGGIVSTTADTLTFFKEFVEKRVNGKNSSELLGETRKLYPGVEYGQGIMKIDFPIGLAGFRKLPGAVGHLGATGHFMVFVPTLGAYIVGTVNQLANPLLGVRLLANLVAALQKHTRV
jgi:D-alanyl-D-alanine carboxypeptidase